MLSFNNGKRRMIPYKDDNPQLQVPYVTYALIALNIVSWLWLQGLGAEGPLSRSICNYGLIPSDLWPAPDAGPGMCSTSGAGWFAVFSSMFMHGSWMHIVGNMWFLWVFGDNVEDAMGRLRFAVFYVLSGVAAAVAQVLSAPESLIPMVGASGAIGGVMGAYIVLYPRVKVHLFVILLVIFTTFRVPAVAMLGYWIVVQLIGGFTSVGATGGGVEFLGSRRRFCVRSNFGVSF